MLYMDKGVCSECNAICYVFKVRLLYTVLDVSDVTTQLESQLSFSSFRGKPKHIASSSYANHQFNMLCHLVFYLYSNFLLLHSNHLPSHLTPQIHMIPHKSSYSRYWNQSHPSLRLVAQARMRRLD
jgi:hypothetical protein